MTVFLYESESLAVSEKTQLTATGLPDYCRLVKSCVTWHAVGIGILPEQTIMWIAWTMGQSHHLGQLKVLSHAKITLHHWIEHNY